MKVTFEIGLRAVKNIRDAEVAAASRAHLEGCSSKMVSMLPTPDGMRIHLPLTVFTGGDGGFLLLQAGVLETELPVPEFDDAFSAYASHLQKAAGADRLWSAWGKRLSLQLVAYPEGTLGDAQLTAAAESVLAMAREERIPLFLPAPDGTDVTSILAAPVHIFAESAVLMWARIGDGQPKAEERLEAAATKALKLMNSRIGYFCCGETEKRLTQQ